MSVHVVKVEVVKIGMVVVQVLNVVEVVVNVVVVKVVVEVVEVVVVKVVVELVEVVAPQTSTRHLDFVGQCARVWACGAKEQNTSTKHLSGTKLTN